MAQTLLICGLAASANAANAVGIPISSAASASASSIASSTLYGNYTGPQPAFFPLYWIPVQDLNQLSPSPTRFQDPGQPFTVSGSPTTAPVTFSFSSSGSDGVGSGARPSATISWGRTALSETASLTGGSASALTLTQACSWDSTLGSTVIPSPPSPTSAPLTISGFVAQCEATVTQVAGSSTATMSQPASRLVAPAFFNAANNRFDFASQFTPTATSTASA